MSVILEFTIDDEAFLLGQVLSPPPKMHIELERLVPTGSMVMPYLWVTGGDTDDFEANVRAHSNVKEFQVLNRLGDRVLYRIEWENQLYERSLDDFAFSIFAVGAQSVHRESSPFIQSAFPSDHTRLHASLQKVYNRSSSSELRSFAIGYQSLVSIGLSQ